MGAFKELAIDIEESLAHFLDHLSLHHLSHKETLEVKEKIDHCAQEMEKISHDLWITLIKQAKPTLKPTYRYKRHKTGKGHTHG